MASRGSGPSACTSPRAVYESGDIELRFGNNQKPQRAHSVFLSLASPTVLAPMIDAEDRKASYLMVENDDRKAWEATLEMLYISVGEASPGLRSISLDALFPTMPILHKYNCSKLLKHTELLVPCEVDWAKGTKKSKHSVGEWLWLLDDLQLVGLHSAFQGLLKGLPNDRLCVIAQEMTAAATTRNSATAAGMLMSEFDPRELQSVEKVLVCPGRTAHEFRNKYYHGGNTACPKSNWHTACIHCKTCSTCFLDPK